MHTTYSDGESTVTEYAERAAELGLGEIAITDHVWRSTEWVTDYLETVRDVDTTHDVTIHAGVEAKVINKKGEVDVSEDDADAVDFVMGVVHRYRPESEPPYDDSCNFTPPEASRQERDLTLAMLENPTVDVVGHPTRNYYKFHYDDDAPEFPDDYLEQMIEKAQEVNKPLEYNARLPDHIRERLLRHYIETGHEFTVGSDSHRAEELDNLDRGIITAVLTGGDSR
jgi:histidinol phosphatase-like PHP family hydrolase